MLLACTDPPQKIEAPEGVTHVAVLELEAGIVARTSALRPLEELSPLWIDAEDETVARLLVGFDDAALLDPRTGVVSPALATTPLALAGPCEPALSPPIWVVRAQNGAFTSENAGAVPALSAKWLEERCAPPPALELELRCAEPRCIVERIDLDPCTVELKTAGCALGDIRLSYDSGALKCLELQNSPWQCEREVKPGRDVFLCDPSDTGRSCTMELLDAASDETPGLEIRRAIFGELPPAAPDSSSFTTLQLPRRLTEVGQGFDLVALPGRIAISAIADGEPKNCPIGRDRKLLFFDAETLEPAGTATAPPCLEHLGRDGENFVGGFKGPNGEVMFGRFDGAGRLLRAIDVFDGEHEADVRVIAVRELAAGWVLLLDETPRPDFETASRIVFVNRGLEIIGHTAVDDFMYGFSAVPPDRAAVWARGGSLVRIFESDGSSSESTPLQILGAYRPTTSIVSGDYLVLFASDDKEISSYRLDPLEPFGIFGTFGEPGYVIAAETWVDGKLIIAGGASGGPRTAYRPELYFFDPAESRALPGRHSLEGLGPITQIRKGEGDTYWMLMPWDGVFLRVRAAAGR